MIYRIEHYVARDREKDLFIDWLLRMRDARSKVAVIRRLARIEQGNFGDHRYCRDGVWELRVDSGPGYRVYYARIREGVVLLLLGGEKRTQEMDIDRAVQYWRDWQRRRDDAE